MKQDEVKQYGHEVTELVARIILNKNELPPPKTKWQDCGIGDWVENWGDIHNPEIGIPIVFDGKVRIEISEDQVFQFEPFDFDIRKVDETASIHSRGWMRTHAPNAMI